MMRTLPAFLRALALAAVLLADAGTALAQFSLPDTEFLDDVRNGKAWHE